MEAKILSMEFLFCQRNLLRYVVHIIQLGAGVVGNRHKTVCFPGGLRGLALSSSTIGPSHILLRSSTIHDIHVYGYLRLVYDQCGNLQLCKPFSLL